MSDLPESSGHPELLFAELLVPSLDRYGRSPQDLVPGRFVAAVASFLV
ncbi:hypothetical protein GTW37_09435 [Streptomyces sp. SID4931]|nr:hypothetical protein [Streptomyces sp. SID4931]SCF77142.1 hypothetical protein GA0115255_105793 [Streptomyces sp. Ncost-T6T-2b]